MKKNVLLPVLSFFYFVSTAVAQDTTSKEMFFVSDTQQPMLVEELLLKPDHNKKATQAIFDAILQNKPASLYMLGDVVALGYASHRWKKVDAFLDSCRRKNIAVYGILGNHEIMIRKKRGEKEFQQRFTGNVPTGYLSVTDSVAVVLLNSNFAALTADENKKQSAWYKASMARLDTAMAVKAIIVCCHHAPYTNSRVVKGNTGVQQLFVPAFIASSKARLFITGHAHRFEHFSLQGKDFLVIGGGGGLQQPTRNSKGNLADLATDYKPLFHYLAVKRAGAGLAVLSYYLKPDFSGFEKGVSFMASP